MWLPHLLLLIVSCTEEGEFHQRFAKTYCDTLDECSDGIAFPDRDSCRDDIGFQLDEFCDGFDKEYADDCIEDLKSAECTEDGTVAIPRNCENACRDPLNFSMLPTTGMETIDGGCLVEDAANDCAESSNTTVDTCSGGIDIVEIRGEETDDGHLCFTMVFREPAPESSPHDLRYGFSFLNEHPASDWLSMSLDWNSTTATWIETAEVDGVSGDAVDYELGPGEGMQIVDGNVEVCVELVKVEGYFVVKQYGGSGQLQYSDGGVEFDKRPNNPYDGCFFGR